MINKYLYSNCWAATEISPACMQPDGVFDFFSRWRSSRNFIEDETIVNNPCAFRIDDILRCFNRIFRSLRMTKANFENAAMSMRTLRVGTHSQPVTPQSPLVARNKAPVNPATHQLGSAFPLRAVLGVGQQSWACPWCARL